MKRTLSRVAMSVAAGSIVGLLLCVAAFLAGARINTTRSIPLGLYWTSDRPVAKGVLVMFCPPQVSAVTEARSRGYIGAGFCPGGFGYLMKRVAAFENDGIIIDEEGVRVNGTLLPSSMPLSRDAHGRGLPTYRTSASRLNEHQVLLMADANPLSFDGRYFGPVQRSSIESVITPVLTW